MSAILDCALELAHQRVRFFPVRPNSKLPAIADFPNKATSDAHQITEMFGVGNYNSGIACGKIAEGLYLVGFDIDNKDGRNGYETLELMEMCGEEFPATWAQKTPSGGEHQLFWSPVPIRQGTNVCGSGIDFRGDGGYLVGPGSTINGVPYSVLRHLPIARFPDWAIEKYQKIATVHSLTKPTKGLPAENQILALKRSVEYLQAQGPTREGARSNDAFKHAARMKDFGLEKGQILEVLADHWACEPPLTLEELTFTINNAFAYSKSPMGVDAIERKFTDETTPEEKKLPPEDALNKDHFYMAFAGVSKVYKESIDEDGKKTLDSFPLRVFHDLLSNKKTMHNGKLSYISKLWMESPNRRQYDRPCFDPSGKKYQRKYNLWRGFAVEPAGDVAMPAAAAEAVELFLEHVEQNICSGNKAEAQWLLGYFAHIFQKPAVKPGVSVVFKGKKGTGKTIISEILNSMIGDNSIIVSAKAHVLGHFNSLMEDKILVTLDEAFWSGDKSIEGILKDVITGNTRIITHKGAESYKAQVYDRIIIIGNDRWIVPASEDERRYAVFKVADNRRQDRNFFGRMKDGMAAGGAELLMKFFLDYDLSKSDPCVAPDTKGLREQKEHSLGVFENWWLNCLQENKILGSGLNEWPEEIPVQEFYQSFVNNLRMDKYSGYIPNKISVGITLKDIAPSCSHGKNTTGNIRKYKFVGIEKAREEWDTHMGFKSQWD